MKKLLVFWNLFLFSITAVYAGPGHPGQNFYEFCDKVSMPNCTDTWNGITSNDTAVYVVGNDGFLYISYHDGGVMSVLTGVSDSLVGIQFLNNSTGFIWGANGTLLKTTNGGLNWSSISTDTTSTIDKVQFIDENNGYFMVDTIIHKTINGGTSWIELILPASISFQDFHFFDALNGQICGNNSTPAIAGYLYETINGGVSWTQIYTDTIAFTQLDYPEASTGFLYGTTTNDPILLKSVDTGVSWAIEHTVYDWTLGSDVGMYNNQPTFISNDTLGDLLFHNSLMVNDSAALLVNSRNLYVVNHNGQESIYILAKSGLFRYFSGETICSEIYFGLNGSGVVADTSNPYNSVGAGKVLSFIVLTYNAILDTLKSTDCKLTCRSPYVTILDSLSVLTNLPPNSSTTWATDNFKIYLHNDIPDNYILHLEFEYANKVPVSSTTKSTFDLPIILSPFEFNESIVIDTATINTTGNGDSVLYPGETASMYVSINNTTTHSFYSMKGKLVSPFEQVEIWDNIARPDGQSVMYNQYSYGTIFSSASNKKANTAYAVTNNFDTIYKLPCSIVFNGKISSYKDDNGYKYTGFSIINYNWQTDFYINDSIVFSAPPDSLLDVTDTIVDPIPDVTDPDIDTATNIEINGIKKDLFVVYPNPTNGIFNIVVPSNNLDNTRIELYNLIGEELINIYHQVNAERISVDMTNYTDGIYLLKIIRGNQTQTFRIVKVGS